MREIDRYLRFSLPQRIEHWLLTLSFSTLGVTGLAQKFSSGWFAEWIIRTLGGIESVRVIHRGAAIIMMLETIYHLGVVGYRVFVRRSRLTMLPDLQDARVALLTLLYNLGLRQDRPQQGRYTFEEKVEYWAVVWGTLIMTMTGFMLWNPIATSRILPGEFIPAAKAAHGAEAVLAVSAIFIWHFYGVHVKRLNKSIFNGHLSEEHMLEEHALELAEIRAGVVERAIDPRTLAKRRRSFSVVYAVSALVLLTGVYAFISFEETAIATVPPAEDVVVFAPLTPTPLPTPLPSPTPLPTPTPTATALPGVPTAVPGAGITWQEVAPLFQQKCSTCHGDDTTLGGLNLATYQTALAGGKSGPAIQPGDADASLLVIVQAQGDHSGQFSPEELERVRQWIADGALEK